MRGQLLNCNHVDAIYRRKPGCIERFEKIPPETPARVCAITLGEIEAGLRMTGWAGGDDFLRFIHEHLLPHALEVSIHARSHYADLMEGILMVRPKSPKVETERHLVDQGVDVNDVWLVSVALEHGLTLLTQDKMTCIREAMKAMGLTVDFDCWI